MEVIYLITAKQKNKLETLPIPFSIKSRIMFIGCVLNIACKAANGPLCMQLLRKKETNNNQGMGNGGRKQYGQ